MECASRWFFVMSIVLAATACVGPSAEQPDGGVEAPGGEGEGEPVGEGEGEGEGEGPPSPPACVAHIASVNGATFSTNGSTLITRFDNVRLTSAASQAQSPATSIASRAWVIERRPSDSQVFLTSTADEEVGFGYDGEIGIDVLGEYLVRLTVTDDLGATSTCLTGFIAQAIGDLMVQLTWSSDVGDLDLHVTKQATTGEFCFDSTENTQPAGLVSSGCDNALDCNHVGCDGTATTPDWDGDLTVSDGDPRLDIDDIQGFGPEQIRVAVMPPGQYVAAVVAVEVPLSTTATLRTYLFGQLAMEQALDMPSSGTFAEGVLLRWPEGPGPVCIEDLTDGSADDQLAACDG